MARKAWVLAVLLVACGGSSGETELFSGDPADAGHDGAGGSGDVDATDEADGGEGGSGGGERVCAPGKVEACACPSGGTGAQRCRDDGAGYDDCLCSDADSGTSVPGWEWWCSETEWQSCLCQYAAKGERELLDCPKTFGCCIRYDVSGKPSQCECTRVADGCDYLAELKGGTVVKQCPP